MEGQAANVWPLSAEGNEVRREGKWRWTWSQASQHPTPSPASCLCWTAPHLSLHPFLLKAQYAPTWCHAMGTQWRRRQDRSAIFTFRPSQASLSFPVLSLLSACQNSGDDGGGSDINRSCCRMGVYFEQGVLQTSPSLLLKTVRFWDHHEIEAQRDDTIVPESHS